MKGFIRRYEEGLEIKSKLYWCAICDCYLNFYKDKKNPVPSSIINLEECEVLKIFSKKYNTDLIQIKTQYKQSLLLIPENIKDFTKWERCLIDLSLGQNAMPRKEKLNIVPRNIRNIENDEYHSPIRSKPMNSQPSRRTSDYNNDQMNDEYQNLAEPPKRFIKHNNGHPRRVESIIRHSSIPNEEEEYYRRPSTPTAKFESTTYLPNQSRPRGISTVKENPLMNDDEILETKTLDELRKKYPISDKTKRWSIAASDLVGKSNDELFIMLIQLNREKSHMDIWKETLEKQLDEINDKLENQESVENREELENSQEYIVNQLNEIDYMINLAHPLVSFLESVVKMSDVYQGNNQTFHVVYHQHPPSGKEDFSNIDFIRLNQEREVAKLINENQNFSSNNNNNNTLKSSSRSLRSSGKENNPELASDLRKSQKFIDRKKELGEVLDYIENQLLQFVPIKNNIEEFIANNNSDKTNSVNKTTPNLKSSVKNVKSQNPIESKTNNLLMMPRRSTRKSPKSDMIASLNRSERSNRQQPLTPQLSNNDTLSSHSLSRKSLNEKFNSQQSDSDLTPPMKFKHSSHSLNEQKCRKASNSSSQDVNDYAPESRLQNKLRELVYDDSPLIPRKSKPTNNSEPFYQDDGPLIKLNVDRYHNINRPNKINLAEKSSFPNEIRGSISNSDISVDSTLIKQRMNLNESFDNNKMWKNPGKVYKESQVSNNNIKNDNVGSDKKADNFIENLFASPAKVEIKERYRSSPSEDYNVDHDRSNRIRNQIIKESVARYSEQEIGERSEREVMLRKNAMLAQEASRRSRQL